MGTVTAPRSELARSRADLLERLGIVEHQLMTAHLDRVIWHELRDEIVERFPDADANFLFSYRRLYTHGQAMRVRRLADQHRDKPRSLHWILAKVRDDPRLAARSLVMADLADDQSADSAAAAWTERFGPGDEPDRAVISRLLDRLAADARRVTDYVDKNVAHRDTDGDRFKVTYDELERAIDDVAAIANDTSLLVRGGTVGYENTWVSGDWHEPFRPSLFPLEPDRA